MKSETFRLCRDEVRQAMQLTGRLKTNKNRKIGILVLTVICIATLAVNIIMKPAEIQNYVLLAAVVAVIAVAAFSQMKTEKTAVDRAFASADTEITAELLSPIDGDPESVARIRIKAGEAEWDIEKSDVCRLLQNENIFALDLEDSRIVILPKRALSPDGIDFINLNFCLN